MHHTMPPTNCLTERMNENSVSFVAYPTGKLKIIMEKPPETATHRYKSTKQNNTGYYPYYLLFE